VRRTKRSRPVRYPGHSLPHNESIRLNVWVGGPRVSALRAYQARQTGSVEIRDPDRIPSPYVPGVSAVVSVLRLIYQRLKTRATGFEKIF